MLEDLDMSELDRQVLRYRGNNGAANDQAYEDEEDYDDYEDVDIKLYSL